MADPFTDAPKSYRDLLDRIGGRNAYGLPMWRLCIAEHRLEKSFGILHNLPTGDVSIFDVDSRGKAHYAKPSDSVQAGMFELPKYPCEGWIVERWFPPAAWGTREEWEAHRGEHGGRMMGPYPAEGDYWMLLGPWAKLPEMGDLENAIQMYEAEQRKRPTNIEAYVKQRIRDAQDAREKRREAFEKTLNEMRKSDLVPVLKSTSLEAERYRQQLQKLTGNTSHLGVVLNP